MIGGLSAGTGLHIKGAVSGAIKGAVIGVLLGLLMGMVLFTASPAFLLKFSYYATQGIYGLVRYAAARIGS